MSGMWRLRVGTPAQAGGVTTRRHAPTLWTLCSQHQGAPNISITYETILCAEIFLTEVQLFLSVQSLVSHSVSGFQMLDVIHR